ncbi:MAG TPA: AAA family ATPase, partial [Polyangiaceae bacterium]|nr:AAA family ATPase [Polyangiaceae bacterium]
ELEVKTLLEAFSRVVTSGDPELLLVSGYSGVGKSSLVGELGRALVVARGLFATGKFDQYKADVPYSTLAQACQVLVRRLLVASEPEVATYRRAIEQALGGKGRLITDLVPELELVIGPQPELPELSASEAQNRFHAALTEFIGVFAERDHPLVLFIDDLQRLDSASLKALEAVLSCPDLRYLLVIGAYRDNEVGPGHPLPAFLDSIRQTAVPVRQIVLEPLSAEDLGRLVTDTLHTDAARAAPLAELILERTGGNPFFAIQFLGMLHEEGLLTFDQAGGGWRWDIARIQEKGLSANVVELMLVRLGRLSQPTRAALQALAFLGNEASVEKLALVLESSPTQTRSDLWPAALANLLTPSGQSYRFAHDRIEEAAYALLPESKRAAEHLRIARLLLTHASPAEIEEDIFQLADQFNRALDLVHDPAERARVAELDFRAGKKAKAGTAYASAQSYLAHACALFDGDTWDSAYEYAFELTIELSECEYLVGNFERAEELFSRLLKRARSRTDRAKVRRLQAKLYQVTGRFQDAVTAGLEGLADFGVTFPATAAEVPLAVAREVTEVKANLGGRSVTDLLNAPLATDADARDVIALIVEVLAAAYNAKSPFFALLILKAVNHSLRFGTTPESCVAYGFHGLVCIALFDDVTSAFEYSELSLLLQERFRDKTLRPSLLHLRGSSINYKRRHFSTSQPILDEGYAVALECGDLVYAGYISIISVWHHFESEETLDRAFDASLRYTAFLKQSKNFTVHHLIRQYQQFFLCLKGLTRGPLSLDDDSFDEASCIEYFESAGYGVGLAIHATLKLIAAYVYERFDEAFEFAREAEARVSDIVFSATETTETFYHALTLAAVHDKASPERKAELVLALQGKLRRLKTWAANCPENFLHRRLLVEAELARIERRDLEAMRLYDRAIEAAQHNAFVQKEALGCEVAARFYLERGFPSIAHAYLRRARANYRRWGALGKVNDLDRHYPGMAQQEPEGVGLDLSRVVKASQAVSDEIVFEKLIEKLMTSVLDQAGAQRGLLLLPTADGLTIEAEAQLTAEGVEVRGQRGAASPDQLPVTVLRYVERTHENVILDHASASGCFVSDHYVKQHRAKSILCVPLLKQARLVGVLYLENALSPGAFTPDRVATLRVLASQAAISLENAELYARVIADVRERERKEQALRISEERFSKVFRENPTPMAVIRSRDGAYVDANKSLLSLLGRTPPELLGRSAKELGPAFVELVQTLRQTAGEEAARELAVELPTRGGKIRSLLVSSEAIELDGERCFLVSLTDVTERNLVEAKLHQVQKMEAVGSVAGGMAHDFNNLLMLINGNSELAMMNMEASDPNYELVRAIFESGSRAADLTRKLLAFGRRESVEPKVWRLDAIVAEMERILRRLIPESVELVTTLAEGTGSVLVDRGQVEQIILNLAINSRDAMPGGGKLSLETANVVLGPHWRDTLLEAAAGPYVMLAVSDTGTGMTEDVRTHVFEPFFTTKELGKGSGLGLAVVYGIVKQAGGNISLSSEPGRGTVIRVYFPRVALGAETTVDTSHARKPRPPQGQETVLLVEDEAAVRKFVARALLAQGYDVLQAESGRLALEVLDQSRRRVDIVVTDVIMPDMGGRELGAHLRQRFPNIPILYMSGYAKDLDQKVAGMNQNEAFLAKPFAP